jgi:hypothetical protein
MIGGLSAEYQQIGAHYNMLRSTPAFEGKMLDEFASDLRVLERDITQRLRVLEQDNARFEANPSLNSIRFFLEELRHRRDPAKVMQLHWKIGTYFGLTLMTLLFGALEAWVPPSDPIESASTGFCWGSVLVISRHLYLHFRLNDVFVHVVGWAFLVLCTAGFNQFDPAFPFSWSSLMFKVALPLVVYHGLVVEAARGKIKGSRQAKTT